MKKTRLLSLLIAGVLPGLLCADTVTLEYSTYLGGSGNSDIGYAVAVDADGCAYVAGKVNSSDFPVTNAYQSSYGGNYDAFLTKFSSNGQSLVYSTYLGGNGNDWAYGLAVDAHGCAYVVGYVSSTNFPTANAYQSANNGSIDAFLTKFASNGQSLVFSTYLGGSSDDRVRGVAVDSNDCAYVVGYTVSTNFPTVNAYQGTKGANYDLFVTKFVSNGQSLVYSTYLGGNGVDYGYGIDLDTSGCAYLAGYVSSTDFPTTNAIQSTNAGMGDVCVAKLSANGQSLLYSTYLGGSDVDEGYGIAVDSSDNAYVVGKTASTTSAILFPTTADAYQTNGSGTSVAIFSKISASGTNLAYSTYFGGSGDDYGYGVAVDASGCAYIAGDTQSPDFPVSNAYQSVHGGSADAFVAQFSSGNQLLCSTYLGGSGGDSGRGVALDASGDVYVAGSTSSANFPVTNAYQSALVTGTDVFLSKLVMPSAAAGAEMAVLGTNGALIANGEAASTVKGTDFGYVVVGGNWTNTFSITNSGAAALNISSSQTSQTTPTGQTNFFLQGVPATVAVGGVSNFTVRFSPDVAGDYAASVAFVSDDPNSPFTLNLAGSVFGLSTNTGPAAGGNTIIITNGTLGSGSDITNVTVGGATATITAQGANWVQITLGGSTDQYQSITGDVFIQSTSEGDTTFADSYTYEQGTNLIYYADASRADDSGNGQSWATAKQTIQAAIDLTVDTDTVLVTNGVYDLGGNLTPGYALTNRVCITNAITVESVNGRNATIIVGAVGTGGDAPLGSNAVRCLYLANNAVISGFTLTNGHTFAVDGGNPHYDESGGGVICAGAATITNCIVTGCSAAYDGGGVFCCGGGTVNNSIMRGNSSAVYGGGVLCWGSGGEVNRCEIYNNTAQDGAGVVMSGGGGLINNCLVRDNTASRYGGGIVYDNAGIVNNCTISGNSAGTAGGGVGFNTSGELNNSVVWGNSGFGSNVYVLVGSATIRNTCSGPAWAGSGNIGDDPLFLDESGDDYRISPVSPCLNRGDNTYAPAGSDLAGNTRIMFTTVDMGAYECQYQLSAYTGPSVGGNSIIITNGTLGSGLDITNVTVCGVQATITDQGANWVDITLGAGPSGGATGDVVIRSTSEGDTTFTDTYTYNPAGEIQNLLPSSGSWTGGYQVVISGSNLCNGVDVTNVTLCGVGAASIDSQSATQIVVTADSGTPGIGDVVVYSTSYGMTTKNNAFEYLKQSQTINFPAIPDQETTNEVDLAATATSGLAVTFAVGAGPASIGGGTNLSFTGAGAVSIVASQAGDANWNTAPDVTNTFNVTKATAAVTLYDLAQTYDGTARVVTNTTVPAGLTVDLTYEGLAWAPTNVGTYAITGTVNDVIYQGGATDTLMIGQAGQIITFPAIPDQAIQNTYGLAATASSGLDVSFVVGSGPASIAGGTNMSFSATGLVSVVASQAGNANWNAAPNATNTFNVYDDVPPTILGCPGDINTTNDPGYCSAVVTWTSPTATDNWAVAWFTNDFDPGDAFSVGTTMVSYVAQDLAGNTSTCAFDVVVNDVEVPTITCPGNIFAYTDPGTNTAVVTYAPPDGSDNCSLVATSQVAGLPSGSTFPSGTTVNAFSVTDASGNTNWCSFSVTVFQRYELRTEAAPAQHDTPTPFGYGSTQLLAGIVVSNAVTTPADEAGGTRSVCTGWTGSGSVPLSGSANWVVITQRADSVLIWHWVTEHYLSLTRATNAVPGWKREGFVYDLFPTNIPGQFFDHWETNGAPAGSNVPLNITMDAPKDVAAIFQVAFIDVTSNTTARFVDWWLNLMTGTMLGDLELCNNTDSTKRLLEPFWYVAESNATKYLMHPDGTESNSGYPYVNITTQMLTAVTNVGNGDTYLDPGECVIVPDIEFYSRYRTPPEGFLYAIWADPPGAGSGYDSASTDTDRDGMLNVWEDSHGLNKNDPFDGEADADRDGASNLHEYKADTNPEDPDSYLHIGVIPQPDGSLVVEWIGGSAVTQYIEESETLGAWSTIHTNPPPTGITNQLQPEDGMRKYFRIRVGR